MRQYTWAIKWNVSDLPSEELSDMNQWNMASTLLDGRSDGIENIYFDSQEACYKWLRVYIKNVIRDNQVCAAIAIKATYRIFKLAVTNTNE